MKNSNKNPFSHRTLSRPPHRKVYKNHTYGYTCKLASILPTFVDQVAPGESFTLADSTKLYTLPFFAPIFSGIKHKTRYFAIPERKCIPNFESWLLSNPSDMLMSIYTTIADIINSPLSVVNENVSDSSLADYMGWPTILRQFVIECFGQDLEWVTANFSDLRSQLYEWDSVSQEYVLISDIATPVSFLAYAAKHPKLKTPYCSDTETWDPSKPTEKELDFTKFMAFKVSLAPFCAYQKCISDWLVDRRFEPDFFEFFFDYYNEAGNSAGIYVDYTDTFDYEDLEGNSHSRNTLGFLMAKRVIGYGKDRFTTCSTEQQRGESPVIGPQKLDLLFDVTQQNPNNYWGLAGTNTSVGDPGSKGKLSLVLGRRDNNQSENAQGLLGDVWAQVNEADEITPVKLRWQMALQNLLERQNISGYSRYTDFILGQYGIRVPDPYLQRSIYLGGYSTDINAIPVTAMADGNDGDENSSTIGEMAAKGEAYNQSPVMQGRIAHDHCFIMGLSWVVAETYYYQGFRTIFTDLYNLDKPLWEMRNVGEQPVKNYEIYFGENPDAIFGYNYRFSDKTTYQNEIHGELRGNLEYFHTGRKFLSQPSLGGDFIYQRGTDGHDRVFSIDPKLAHPFRINKAILFIHNMCI